jgi:hypothetical protein
VLGSVRCRLQARRPSTAHAGTNFPSTVVIDMVVALWLFCMLMLYRYTSTIELIFDGR